MGWTSPTRFVGSDERYRYGDVVVVFGPPSSLERVVCWCDEDPELNFFDWMDYLVDAKPIFEQDADFVSIE